MLVLMPCAYCHQLSCPLHLPTNPLSPVLMSTFKPSSPAPSTSVSEPSSNLAPVLARSITFDLCVARASLLLDIASHSLVAFHLSTSPLVFVGVTSISALASGTHPALESLAISILQRSQKGSPDIGALFGGLGMLTALGSILAVSPSFASICHSPVLS
jgi:hypothetical protein